MPSISIAFGTILIIIGIVGYAFGVMSEKASFTALIPAAFGTVLAVLGVISNKSEGLRKHLMHAAVVIALLGFIMTSGRLVMKFSELSMSPAVISQLAMAIVCLAFVVLAVRSFAAARSRSEPPV